MRPRAKIVLVQHAIAMQTANMIDEVVDQRIVEPANHHAHGMAHERMIKTRQLPGAQMGGQNEHSAALAVGGEIVLQPIVAKKRERVLGV